MLFRRCIARMGAILLVMSAAGTAPLGAQQAPTVRIATSPSETYAQAFFAQDLGLYTKAGLDAQVITLATGAAVSTAVAGGGADIGVATTVGLANAITHGVPFVMIAPAAMETTKAPSGLLCVAKSSNYHSPKDFVGQTIAVPALKQTVDLGVRKWLSDGGVDPNSVHIVEAPFPEMAASVVRGTYAAAAISEPSLNKALKTGDIRCIADPFASIAPEYMFAAWFTTKQFAEKNPDVVRKVAAALTDAGAWANTHHFDSATIVSKINKVDVETIRAETRPAYATTIRATEIQPQLDAGYKFGFLSRPVTADELLGH